jgi:RNA polymerase sigma-70 factor (ECF subfamily)
MENQKPGLPSDDNSDRSLLRFVRDGNDEAAGQLHDRYAARLQALANRQLARETSGRLDSEDITQSVFRTLFRRLQDGQYDVPAGESIWRLLTTIALNKVRTQGAHHRAAKRDIRRTSHVDQQRLESQSHAGDESAAHELRLTIATLLESLGASEQQMVHLRIEGHDVKSIAKISGRSKRTVERVLQGFRGLLRQTLDEED